jgi:hypothetical protein
MAGVDYSLLPPDVNPLNQEGVFLSEATTLPSFDTQLKTLTSKANDKITPYGTLRREIATMDDGEVYPVVIGTPREKDTISDTAIVYSTAWLTSTRGHNMHTMLRMMDLGYPTIMIGPEGELRNPELARQDRISRARSISLPKVVYDMNRILDVKLAQENVRETEIITLGESRGAMTGFGFDVAHYSGQRRVAYGDLTAPCFARSPKLQELPGIVSQLIPEAMTLGSLALQLFGNRLLHYSGTLHRDPEYYGKELLKVITLMSGQAGELAKASRPETPLHIKVFTGDSWSQAKEWDTILADRPHVKIEPSRGYHLDIAKPSTLRNIQRRLHVLAEYRGFEGSFDTVDFHEVLQAHKSPATTASIGRTAIQAA